MVVCVGNVCRSPMAAALLCAQLGDAPGRITSCGLAALVGQPIAPLAQEVLVEHGLDALDHRARQVSRDGLKQADLVLTMERSHLARLRALAPEASGKMFLLDKWGDSRDIPDPYGQPRAMFERVYAMLEQCTGAWLPHLRVNV